MELSYEWGADPLLISAPYSYGELRRLWTVIGWGRVSQRSDAVWRHCLSRSTHILSVWHHDRLIAFGRVVEDGVFATFYDIAVDPAYQRQGIGTQLMTMLVEQVRNKGYAGIYLFRWGINPGNKTFYEKLGFVETPDGMELPAFMASE